jgi:hypothetical protein
VACQRQHWTSHKRHCRALAQDELRSFVERRTNVEIQKVLNNPDPSELPLFLKLSAITWTIRHHELHLRSLVIRAAWLESGRPVAGDTKATLARLLKRATAELSWPSLLGRDGSGSRRTSIP